MAKDSTYFIKLKNPRQTRRALLENTRDVLKILQGYEDFKRTREKRSSLITTFKNNMNDLKILTIELRKALPKSAIKEIKKPVFTPMAMQKPVKEIRKLEQELAEIEEKLSSV